MLNKELLLSTNPKKKKLEYTHIITIEASNNGNGVGYDAQFEFGGIQPEVFLGEALLTLQTYPDIPTTELRVGGFLGANQVYLGRIDTEEVVKLARVDVNSGFAWDEVMFFTLDDIDTIIPVWIGENPPPLGLEIFLRRFLKETLYVK